MAHFAKGVASKAPEPTGRPQTRTDGGDALDTHEMTPVDPSNSRWYRQVLGQYPTGVCVVTARTSDGARAGFVVGSFTSASLRPPLIAFFPDKSSTSWPKIESAGQFCVNILGAGQEHICRQFAAKATDKFDAVGYRETNSGSPIIEDVVAWMDCELHSVQDAGDHYLVLARVREMDIESHSLPLVFFQGGYGCFSPLPLAAANTRGALSDQLRNVDSARPEMQELADALSARCIAIALVERELVVIASSQGAKTDSQATLVGQRLPFVPPLGAVFAAWGDHARIEDWLASVASDRARAKHRARLETVRRRRYAVGLLNSAHRTFASMLERLAADSQSAPSKDLRELIQDLSYDPLELSAAIKKDIRNVTAPVFAPDGTVALSVTTYGFPKPSGGGGIDAYIERVIETARQTTKRLGGTWPSVI
jgi:flavin reductase (DIM6/NTAB) family NADH-FMN oxidoreductase RutF